MDIKFVKPGPVSGAIIAQVVKGKLGTAGKETDKWAKGALKEALKKAPNFKSKNGETITTYCQHLQADVAILAGYDAKTDLDQQKFGGKVFDAILASKVKEATIMVDGNDAQAAANIAFGAKLKAFFQIG